MHGRNQCLALIRAFTLWLMSPMNKARARACSVLVGHSLLNESWSDPPAKVRSLTRRSIILPPGGASKGPQDSATRPGPGFLASNVCFPLALFRKCQSWKWKYCHRLLSRLSTRTQRPATSILPARAAKPEDVAVRSDQNTRSAYMHASFCY